MGNTKKPSQSFWSTEDLQDIASHYPTKDFNQYSPTYNQDVYEKTPLNSDVVRKGYLSKDSKGNITKVPGNPNYGKENSVVSNKPTVAEGGTYQKEGVDKYGRALPASGSKITTDATGRQTQWDSRGEGTPASKPSQSFLPKSGRDWDKNPPTSDGDVIRYEKDIGMPKGIGMMDIEKMPEGPAKQKALKDNADFHKQADAKSGGQGLTSMPNRAQKPKGESDATAKAAQKAAGLPSASGGENFRRGENRSGRDWDKNPPVNDSDVIRYEKDIGMPKGIGLMDIEKMPEGPAKEKAMKANADFHKQADAKSGGLPAAGSKIAGKPGAVADGKGGFSYPGGGGKPLNENPFSGIPKLSNQGQGSTSSGAGGGSGAGGDGDPTNLIDNLDTSLQNTNPFNGSAPNNGSSQGSSQASNGGGWNNGGGMGGGQGGGQGGGGGGQMAGALIGYLKKKKEGLV